MKPSGEGLSYLNEERNMYFVVYTKYTSSPFSLTLDGVCVILFTILVGFLEA